MHAGCGGTNTRGAGTAACIAAPTGAPIPVASAAVPAWVSRSPVCSARSDPAVIAAYLGTEADDVEDSYQEGDL